MGEEFSPSKPITREYMTQVGDPDGKCTGLCCRMFIFQRYICKGLEMNLLEIKFLSIDEGMILYTDIGQNH